MGILHRLAVGKTKTRPPRLGTRVPAVIRVDVRRARDGTVHSVLLEDLSSSGARISTPVRFARNDVVSLTLTNGRVEKMEPVCRIASIRPRRGELHIDYGLKFVALSAQDAENIRKLVSRQELLRAVGTTAFSLAREK
jgi:hypothetical protein